MRRDMDKVRIMLKDFSEGKGQIEFEGTEEDKEYIYHLKIMGQAGLIIYKEFPVMGGNLKLLGVPELTWIGNDFLDSTSNEKVWGKTKTILKEKGLELSSVPLDVLIELSKEQLKKFIGL